MANPLQPSIAYRTSDGQWNHWVNSSLATSPSAALAGVRIKWGRESRFSPARPAQAAFTIVQPINQKPVLDIGVGQQVEISVSWQDATEPAGNTFEGRITDVSLTQTTVAGQRRAAYTYTATSLLADWASTPVPRRDYWDMMTLSEWFNLMYSLLRTTGLWGSTFVPPNLPAVRMRWQDGDWQPSMLELLEQLLTTIPAWISEGPSGGLGPRAIRYDAPPTITVVPPSALGIDPGAELKPTAAALTRTVSVRYPDFVPAAGQAEAGWKTLSYNVPTGRPGLGVAEFVTNVYPNQAGNPGSPDTAETKHLKMLANTYKDMTNVQAGWTIPQVTIRQSRNPELFDRVRGPSILQFGQYNTLWLVFGPTIWDGTDIIRPYLHPLSGEAVYDGHHWTVTVNLIPGR